MNVLSFCEDSYRLVPPSSGAIVKKNKTTKAWKSNTPQYSTMVIIVNVWCACFSSSQCVCLCVCTCTCASSSTKACTEMKPTFTRIGAKRAVLLCAIWYNALYNALWQDWRASLAGLVTYKKCSLNFFYYDCVTRTNIVMGDPQFQQCLPLISWSLIDI